MLGKPSRQHGARTERASIASLHWNQGPKDQREMLDHGAIGAAEGAELKNFVMGQPIGPCCCPTERCGLLACNASFFHIESGRLIKCDGI